MEAGVPIIGTSPDIIDLAEDRDRFRKMMREMGIPQPESGMASTLAEALSVAGEIGYPLMVRPSYVLGGRAMHIVDDEEMLRVYMEEAVAIEAEADAISDGTDAFVPAVMEHIELAGVHSGDSACVIPPISIPQKHIETIIEYTRRIAVSLRVVGLMNIQYAIHNDRVYILEANPRASRTVPLVSKVCNIPMARVAMQVMLGKNLSELALKRKTITHFGVKEAVFPFNMFPEEDAVLGPEMKSTGEVLAIADSFGLAFHKAQEAVGGALPNAGTVLITVDDRDKDASLEVCREFLRLGFAIKATEGTHRFLADNGIVSDHILKFHEGRPNIVDAIKNEEINLVINTPGGRRSKHDDSYIRKAAIKYRVPYITTITGALAAARGIAASRDKSSDVRSLQDWHAGIVAPK
jgi:carbamoyl-phosphate synthase large subunit